MAENSLKSFDAQKSSVESIIEEQANPNNVKRTSKDVSLLTELLKRKEEVQTREIAEFLRPAWMKRLCANYSNEPSYFQGLKDILNQRIMQ